MPGPTLGLLRRIVIDLAAFPAIPSGQLASAADQPHQGENMTDPNQQSASQSSMQEMGINDASIERRKKIVGFETADLARIAAIKDLVTQHADDYTATFFNHLSGLDE